MHVEKLPFRLALKQKIHGLCNSGLTRPAKGGVMVRCQNVNNDRYVLDNSTWLISSFEISAYGPYSFEAIK